MTAQQNSSGFFLSDWGIGCLADLEFFMKSSFLGVFYEFYTNDNEIHQN